MQHLAGILRTVQKLFLQAEARAEEYLTLAQRVQADFDNYRRRNESMRAEAMADGTRSNDKWDGYSLQELQQMFLDCGAQTAINLDGGGSTKLYFYGQILNKPTSPTRQVSDALIFR